MNHAAATPTYFDTMHPSAEQLREFVLGELNDDTSEGIEQHLSGCAVCRDLLHSGAEDSLVALLREVSSTTIDNASAVSPSTTRCYRPVPGYEMLELLGQGGMGVVWKARQAGLNRVVALKRIRSAGTASSDALVRFRREAEAVARLHHTNIVQIYEIGEHDGEPYLALEYVGGGSLTQKLTGGPLVPKQAAALVETLARAMHHAHEHGIIHRDLKPGNILLASGGCEPAVPTQETEGLCPPLAVFIPKITDFGLAKQLDETTAHTQSGAILGTPSYMAPEQAGSGRTAISPSTDVYALGAILYETLTGRPPFRGPTVLDTLAQVREREPVPLRQLQPGVPRDLQTICLKCLHKEPQRRYESALELAEDLRRFTTGEPILARPVGSSERLLKWMRRKPYQAVLAGLAVLIPAAVVGGLLWHNDRLGREIVRAQTAERNSEDNYKKSRLSIHNMWWRLVRWNNAGRKNSAEMSEGLIQDGLNYIEAVLNQEDNSDPQVQQDAAEMLTQIARMQVYYGRPEEARASFNKSLKLWERLSEEHPESAPYRTGLADCYRTMDAFVPGDEQQKIAWGEKALQLHEEAARLAPGEDFYFPINVAQCQHALAATFQSAQRPREAEEHYNRSIELMSQIAAKYPKEAVCKSGLADNYGNLALLYHSTGRIQMAESTFQRADALLEAIMKEGSLIEQTTHSRSSVALNWGNLYLERGQTDKALASYDRGLAWCENVLRREPNHVPIREMALKLHGSKANIYGHQKRYAEAAAEWQRVLEFAEGQARLEYRMQRCLALAHGRDSARAAAEADALAIEPGCPPDTLYNCACVHALSGRSEKAIALLRKLQNAGYFDNAEHLKNLRIDPDLDSLRRREDFVKFVKGMSK